MSYETLTGPDMQAVLNGTFERPLVPSPIDGLSTARDETNETCHSREDMFDTPSQQVVKGCGDEDVEGDEGDVCNQDPSP